MSGSEAIVLIGLVDACIGIADTIIAIGKAAKDAKGLPPILLKICARLPKLQELLTGATSTINGGNLTVDSKRHCQPVLEQLQESLNKLSVLFQDACPEDGDGRGKRLWRGTKTAILGRTSKLEKILADINANFDILDRQKLVVIEDKLEVFGSLVGEVNQSVKELQTEQEVGGRYSTSGSGSLVVGNDAQIGEGGNNRFISRPGTYYEKTVVHNYSFRGPETIESIPMTRELCARATKAIQLSHLVLSSKQRAEIKAAMKNGKIDSHKTLFVAIRKLLDKESSELVKAVVQDMTIVATNLDLVAEMICSHTDVTATGSYHDIVLCLYWYTVKGITRYRHDGDVLSLFREHFQLLRSKSPSFAEYRKHYTREEQYKSMLAYYEAVTYILFDCYHIFQDLKTVRLSPAKNGLLLKAKVQIQARLSLLPTKAARSVSPGLNPGMHHLQVTEDDLDYLSPAGMNPVIRHSFPLPQYRMLAQMLLAPLPVQELRTVSISGVSGSGKSVLIRQFIGNHEMCFSEIWWISAENEEILTRSYNRMIYKTGNPEHAKLDLSEQRQLIRRYLENLSDHELPWLVVSDNVQFDRDLTKFVPLKSRGLVVTTTRHAISSWTARHDEILLGPLDRRNAVALMLHQMKLKRQDFRYISSDSEDDGDAQDIAAKNEAASSDIFHLVSGLPICLDAVVDQIVADKGTFASFLRQKYDWIGRWMANDDHKLSFFADMILWGLSAMEEKVLYAIVMMTPPNRSSVPALFFHPTSLEDMCRELSTEIRPESRELTALSFPGSLDDERTPSIARKLGQRNLITQYKTKGVMRLSPNACVTQACLARMDDDTLQMQYNRAVFCLLAKKAPTSNEGYVIDSLCGDEPAIKMSSLEYTIELMQCLDALYDTYSLHRCQLTEAPIYLGILFRIYARVRYELGQYNIAQQLYNNARLICEDAICFKNHPSHTEEEVFSLWSEAELGLGCVYRHMGKGEASIGALKSCINFRERAHKVSEAIRPRLPSEVDIMTNTDIRDLRELGNSFVSAQKFSQALSCYSSTEVYAQRMVQPIYSTRHETLIKWALCLLFMNRYEEALDKIDEIYDETHEVRSNIGSKIVASTSSFVEGCIHVAWGEREGNLRHMAKGLGMLRVSIEVRMVGEKGESLIMIHRETGLMHYKCALVAWSLQLFTTARTQFKASIEALKGTEACKLIAYCRTVFAWLAMETSLGEDDEKASELLALGNTILQSISDNLDLRQTCEAVLGAVPTDMPWEAFDPLLPLEFSFSTIRLHELGQGAWFPKFDDELASKIFSQCKETYLRY